MDSDISGAAAKNGSFKAGRRSTYPPSPLSCRLFDNDLRSHRLSWLPGTPDDTRNPHMPSTPVVVPAIGLFCLTSKVVGDHFMRGGTLDIPKEKTWQQLRSTSLRNRKFLPNWSTFYTIAQGESKFLEKSGIDAGGVLSTAAEYKSVAFSTSWTTFLFPS